MAVYDDETGGNSNPLTPNDLKTQENNQPGPKSFKEKVGLDAESRQAAQQTAMDEKFSSLKEAMDDGFGDGLYHPEKKKSKAKGKGGFLKKKGILAGGGAISIAVIVGGMLGHIQLFQMDHLFKNIEQKTASRLNASLDTRNDYLVRSYIKLRLLEMDGGTKGDTLFFRANQVGSPMQSWYKTMRTSKFEEDLLSRDGISFQSSIGPDGRIRPAKITLRGETLTYDINAKYKNVDFNSLDNKTLGPILNQMEDVDMKQFVDVEVFQNHKEARVAVRAAVNENTHFNQVFKRRHLRRDIASMTGIKSWRLFEKTRDKVALKKQDIKNNLYNKIVDKFYARNPQTAGILKCLFSDGKCASNSDPVAEDNKSPDVTTGDAIPKDANDQTNAYDDPANAPKDKNNNPIPRDVSSETSDIAKQFEESTSDAITGATDKELTKASTRLENASVSKKIIYGLIARLTGKTVSEVVESAVPLPDPSKVWVWAKRIAKIDGLFGGGSANSQLSKMVKNAKRAQLVGLFATYSMANDQMKSGELSSEELNAFFETTQGMGNSEGYDALNGNVAKGGPNASNPAKDAYCAKDITQRTLDEYAWMCDDQKPNSGGRAGGLSDAYAKSVGPFLSPIATSVQALEKSPAGKVLDFVTGLVAKISDATIGKLFSSLMENTGLGKSFGEIMSTVMYKVIGFLGGGPMFDGSQPGNVTANFLIAGGAASAESSTRASGGVASTAQSLAYSTQLAKSYQTEQKEGQSLYTRYASLDNVNSLASTTLGSIHSKSLGGLFNGLVNSFASLPKMMSSVVSGKALADTTESSTAVADWAGVDKFDIPGQCVTLDPLDPDYMNKSTNVSSIGITPDSLGYETLRDTDKFWKAVYDKLGDDKDAESKADKIYNCALLDARAMGSLGNIYGYNDDGGYNPNGDAATAANTPAATAELGISSDGFVFPLKTTKSALINHKPYAWCFSSQANCHHDYNAADIFADTGTVVVAPTDGTIVSTRSKSGGTGSNVVMKSTKGFIYYLTHMKEGSIKVTKGQTIKAGTELGQVGTSADAAGTSPHLHFDAQTSPPAQGRPACSGAECSGIQFLLVQPTLISAFEKLPQ